MYVHIYIYIYINKYMYICICICMYKFINSHVHFHIYVHTHTTTHVYIHTSRRIHMWKDSFSCGHDSFNAWRDSCMQAWVRKRTHMQLPTREHGVSHSFGTCLMHASINDSFISVHGDTWGGCTLHVREMHGDRRASVIWLVYLCVYVHVTWLVQERRQTSNRANETYREWPPSFTPEWCISPMNATYV